MSRISFLLSLHKAVNYLIRILSSLSHITTLVCFCVEIDLDSIRPILLLFGCSNSDSSLLYHPSSLLYHSFSRFVCNVSTHF